MPEDNSLITILIGFLGGIIGGLLVNVVSFHYQKSVERKLSLSDARVDYQARMSGRLQEIITFWESERESNFTMKSVQNKFAIFSQQIGKDISNPPVPLNPDLLDEFRELIVSLNKVRDFLIAIGRRERFIAEINLVIGKVDHILAYNQEWFNK